MDQATKPHLVALIVMAVLGAVAGYLLLLALAGGRYDGVSQCFQQSNGLTTCTDSIPRASWVDVVAACMGALIALAATNAAARRPGLPADA